MSDENLKAQLNLDIINFLDNIENQTENDKIITLRQLFDKHIHLNSAEYMMDNYDLGRIIGSAKQIFSNNNMNIFLGDRKIKVQPADLPNLCVIEATISYLNKIGCLKKIPKFDKRENQFPED